MPKISRTKEMIEMPAGFVPGPQHVICAKGKQAKEHQANRLLRYMVQSNLQEYSECPTKLERSFIVSQILKTLRREGGFVRKVGNKWYDVSDRNAREKIGQLFRDQLHTQFKSSTRAKASVKRQRKHSTSSSSSSSSVSSSSTMATTTPCFPINEVSFAAQVPAVTPSPCVSYPKPQVEIDFRDFEPLPLNQAMVVNFNDSLLSDDSSFDQAIDEMFNQQQQAIDEMFNFQHQDQQQDQDPLFPLQSLLSFF